MKVYYNEFDKKKCAMLSQLMKDGHIRKGDIDDRSIKDVQPDDIMGYDRAHFFAGIGLWDHALNLAGWQEDLPVWTGSCPCQPFSTAGQRKGKKDERHLWPEWYRLIKECKPGAIFGEQVSNAIGSENKSLQNMLERIGTLELLLAEAERQDLLSPRLQELRDREKDTIQERINRAEPFDSDEMEGEIQRLYSLFERETQSEGYEFIFQPDTGMGAGKDRQRDMRINWHSIQSDRRQNMGQPIYRQDSSGEGLHEIELQNGDLFSECDDEQLGREQDNRGRQFYYGDQTEAIRRFANEARREFEKTITKGWLDDVYQGLEAQGYAVGSVVLPACSVGAPHRRDRLWFVANSDQGQCISVHTEIQSRWHTASDGGTMGDTSGKGSQGHRQFKQESIQERRQGTERHSWAAGVWIDCPDGKQRLIEPSIPLLANGATERVGLIHAAGDAIVSQVAAEFIMAFMEV